MVKIMENPIKMDDLGSFPPNFWFNTHSSHLSHQPKSHPCLQSFLGSSPQNTVFYHKSKTWSTILGGKKPWETIRAPWYSRHLQFKSIFFEYRHMAIIFSKKPRLPEFLLIQFGELGFPNPTSSNTNEIHHLNE